MDNMLYILAVLVIILLLAVLVMRRRQARNLTFLGDSRKIKNDRSYKGLSGLETKTLNNDSIATKFDNVTIAERFMDQQRYDKAIETLKRGLIEKPHDDSLLLKLLNVYVVSNQYQDFDRVYHILQAQGDPETIEQADQLKELISDRHTTSFEDSLSDDMSLDSSSFVDSPNEESATDSFLHEDMSLDFDSDQTFGDSQPADTDTDTEIDHRDSSNDSFNLTLDDLEATDTSNDMPEDTNTFKDNDLSNIDIDGADLSTSSNNAANIDDDFTLDFETITEEETEDLLADEHSIDVSTNSDSEALDSADDFTLDLEDYATVLRSDALGEDQPIIEHSIDEQGIDELSIDEFSFDLEESDNSLDNFDSITGPVSDNAISDIDNESHVISSDDTAIIDSDNSSLDDEQTFDFTVADKPASDKSDTNKPITDDIAIDTPSTIDALGALSPAINDEKSVGNELLDDDMMFDDLVFDDNNGLDVEAVTDSSSPVSTQKIILTNNLAPVTLGAILTSDFDYVKTLNSYQVTLELADHYLQLGEYDSAKRLLTEVITQGNSEQQQKAKMLLARTA
ncbi:FimV/HubP family polar landmark protein [Psychrobacter sp. M13]|uniref:FimV/HubP family polar landmark protein n=1 Tax=Psychrobacter sp. M13 TaxID=3067275 RepID=UPI00273BEEAA|nr:FimV/HubP family polar landmark protein [Psychrobacter sp. M13]WLP95338.1 FimV/HubP family polar landmark protein [Psychrobacter sp. M13]